MISLRGGVTEIRFAKTGCIGGASSSMSTVWIDSEFMYNYDDYYIFGYHGLRDAFRMALARALGLRNGRRVLGVRRLGDSSKVCGVCGSRAEVVLLAATSDGKVFGLYFCVNHFKEVLVGAAERIKKSVDSLINGLVLSVYADSSAVAYDVARDDYL